MTDRDALAKVAEDAYWTALHVSFPNGSIYRVSEAWAAVVAAVLAADPVRQAAREMVERVDQGGGLVSVAVGLAQLRTALGVVRDASVASPGE